MSSGKAVRFGGGIATAIKVFQAVLTLAVFVYCLLVAWPFIFVLMPLMLIFHLPIWRSKIVDAEPNGLRVRGLRRAVFVPYAQVATVEQSWRRDIAYVVLKHDTIFGRRISVMTRARQLKEAIEEKARRG